MLQATAVRARLRALGLLGTVPLVALLAPSPATSWASLGSTADPTAPLVALVALVAYACTAWLTLLVVLTCGSHVPGVLGRLAARLAGRIAPAPVRSLVRVALGTTVALSAVGGTASAWAGTPALAGTAGDKPQVSSSYEWPGAATTSPAAPELDWSTPPTSATPQQVVAGPPTATHTVARSVDQGPAEPQRTAPKPLAPVAGPAVGDTVVQQGDSLWTIAARSLGPSATAAQVAQEWPRWWSANRTVVGDHPELIHPGDHLAAPGLSHHSR